MPKLDDPLLFNNPMIALTSARSCALDLTDDRCSVTPAQDKIANVH